MLGLRTSRRAVMGMRRVRWMSSFFEEYGAHVEERAKMGIVQETLDAEQCASVVELCKNPPAGKEDELFHLFERARTSCVWTRRLTSKLLLASIVKG